MPEVYENTNNIAASICFRLRPILGHGSVVIVCDAPDRLIPEVRRLWGRLTRLEQDQRRRTDDVLMITKLTDEIVAMQHLWFGTDELDCPVRFMTVEQFREQPYLARTLFVACDLDREALDDLVGYMPPKSLVVAFGARRG